ncbi:MAG: bifunctional tetrahydrofolate synthase/dihydrofolate synthase [Neptuniibacter sp.]|nr:bifunctional tetrahydrofolate synthase/dihydrofolate synthase [Neptuniibacter sp.]
MSQSEKKLNLSEWLAWMEQCHPSEIELGLDRIKQVAEKLAIDFTGSTVVTVAGTNGKGSTVSYISNIYLKAGYSVGSFTSPHFIEYNERVRLNGVNASDELLCRAFEKIDKARGQIPLTYFEFGTLAALVIFSETKPDLVLLEVGLGGRLDAVNIIDADISVVTTVALDHTDWLGDDRDVIGYEKAGIFRSGKPAICGDLDPPYTVAEHAENIGAQLLQAGNSFSFSEAGNHWHWSGKTAQGQSANIDNIPMPQLPLQNASTALQVCQFIDLDVSEEQLRDGVGTASLTGRMQQIEQDGIQYWLDVAHNPEAAELLQKRVAELSGSKILVLGMLADKDCQQVIQLLEPVFDQIYLVSLNVPRGQTSEQLQAMFTDQAKVQSVASVATVIDSIKNNHNAAENVIIAGSFYTVADALTALTEGP